MSLLTGDCLAVLPTLAAGSCDAVVCDPPYGQTNERYDGPNAVSLRPDVWAACARVCKPNAALVAFAGGPTYHRIASAVEAGGWKVRQMWGWVYRDGMITSAYPKEGFDRLAPAMDPIVFATRGKVLLNAEREGEAWKSTRSGTPYSERSRQCQTTSAAGHYPKTLASDGIAPFEYFDVQRGGRKSADPRNGHPNQKPLSLMRWLIAKLPGGVILDPFAGSGTTGLAAEAEGRTAILIERDPAYAAIATRRLSQAARCEKQEPSLFG